MSPGDYVINNNTASEHQGANACDHNSSQEESYGRPFGEVIRQSRFECLALQSWNWACKKAKHPISDFSLGELNFNQTKYTMSTNKYQNDHVHYVEP